MRRRNVHDRAHGPKEEPERNLADRAKEKRAFVIDLSPSLVGRFT